MYKSEALVRACKYAFVPNKLGYCGKSDFSKLCIDFIKNPKDTSIEQIVSHLKSFKAMYNYMSLIAKHNSLDVFSPEVIEAYWLGNSLLENVPASAVKELIKKGFTEIPPEIRNKKAEFIKNGPLIQHSFHVLYVNFLNPRLKPNIENMNMCLVKYGEVLETKANRIKVKSIKLYYALGELKLCEKILFLENPFNCTLLPGKLVSTHWGAVIEKISKANVKNIKRALFKNIELTNSYLMTQNHS
ncbi:MAG: DUF6390 family protein [Candidatus Diapherotrites archaeon]